MPRHHHPTRPYDPDVHITARELRGLGFYLAENVDDDAYVRRVAVSARGDEPLRDGSPSVGLDVLEPFTAVEEESLAFAI